MKTPRRIITIGLVLAVIACALVLTLRSVAQSGPYDIDLSNKWQKLKAPYNEDADAWETNILKKHSKKYCITHHKTSNGKESKHCPKSQTSAAQALPNPVSSSSAPIPMSDNPTGVNVTQRIPCSTQEDQDAVTATFDTSGG